eukprot:313000-Chlamydomonas_euryale.AAC.1
MEAVTDGDLSLLARFLQAGADPDLSDWCVCSSGLCGVQVVCIIFRACSYWAAGWGGVGWGRGWASMGKGDMGTWGKQLCQMFTPILFFTSSRSTSA